MSARRLGVLTLQGAYAAHAQVLERLGAQVRPVRLPADFEGLDGLVIPGGESTTMLRLLERDEMFAALQNYARHKPCLGTCAGAILLAHQVSPAQASLDILDIDVQRNGYGRQLDSAIISGPTALPGGPLEMVFIRAPRFTRIGKDVEVLAERDGEAVLVRQGRHLAASFHPELGEDPRVHQAFLDGL
ncbi:pyridoxal 5'-phosphate synthase glutaminase subunit PdxT [Frateuria aurantia]|uniref:glutaminase n=1 Tax=Frateuria aurantia (strain ATCC 33424 / DSM 6220 / KCTC 2777 / LMG 1558 / NBRC 3245 / NCIMB 13370) TaxID=767434 RepID=H8L443_FRAAD|nr:pyridoxal 5'-phosphate synthase glutaminase subunit PdxT [Frateuria aurantia]AFC86519.1 pyridoxal 5''-phosphate synthase, glutaminase subunit Pdx2 [Frateuria aurantia DSM 6220]